MAIFVQANTPGEALWGHELVALTRGVSAVIHDGWKWSPNGALQLTEFAEAPRAADSPITRLLQMKAMSRRITITETYQGETLALRIQPRPIYRYQNEERGLIDGVDPSRLKDVHARMAQSESSAGWHVISHFASPRCAIGRDLASAFCAVPVSTEITADLYRLRD